ncbi:Sucrose specific transcriptional regulator CscR [Pseudomonas savastanoi pv. glycinea]|uniref:Sucrose specific transcriptional regulator CscR n=1 Tax=Pseudomonas savastanoi pv. glycinea TaxID=318 RepID=A0A3M3FFP8_PSESG|nr:Sucrose specific transcriptional regulator CscR [Pseudomonas savastanoi pv. glycinea]RMM99854.1 Sucrose specific transcriptional regulator CscR [Pseudomonas savastanoi pv. glycinea]RMV59419.1 Sucrose specific transcriptional regulator CscR [Pseudomonas savastanoi pv. glycinea]
MPGGATDKKRSPPRYSKPTTEKGGGATVLTEGQISEFIQYHQVCAKQCLTTVQLPYYEIGRNAARHLIESLEVSGAQPSPASGLSAGGQGIVMSDLQGIDHASTLSTYCLYSGR